MTFDVPLKKTEKVFLKATLRVDAASPAEAKAKAEEAILDGDDIAEWVEVDSSDATVTIGDPVPVDWRENDPLRDDA
jgi:hypothetical protein